MKKVFDTDNYLDADLMWLRDILFSNTEYKSQREVRIGDVRVEWIWYADDNIFLLFDDYNERAYVISIYKHRGRTQAFYRMDTGENVTYEEFLEIKASLERTHT